MKRNKRILVSLLSLALCLMLSATYVGAAQKEDGGGAEIQWDNTLSVDINFGFLDGKGYADGMVMGRWDVTYVTVDVTVYRQYNNHWLKVGEGHEVAYDYACCIYYEFNIIPRTAYRADYVFTVYRDGVPEVITRTAHNVYVPK